MTTRACCFNCGLTAQYKMPYRARITDYKREDGEVIQHSSYATDDGKVVPLICHNCGWNTLEVVYWDGTKKADPFLPVRLAKQ